MPDPKDQSQNPTSINPNPTTPPVEDVPNFPPPEVPPVIQPNEKMEMPPTPPPPTDEKIKIKTEETDEDKKTDKIKIDNLDIPPVVAVPGSSKKFGSKKMIATILGLVVLVGGLATGLFMVKRNQDIREKAYALCYSDADCSPGYTCRVDTGSCVKSSTPVPTVAPTPSCGTNGQSCCNGYICNPTLICVANTCMKPSTATPKPTSTPTSCGLYDDDPPQCASHGCKSCDVGLCIPSTQTCPAVVNCGLYSDDPPQCEAKGCNSCGVGLCIPGTQICPTTTQCNLYNGKQTECNNRNCQWCSSNSSCTTFSSTCPTTTQICGSNTGYIGGGTIIAGQCSVDICKDLGGFWTKYYCENQFKEDVGNGCNTNLVATRDASQGVLQFDDTFCGVQQIDCSQKIGGTTLIFQSREDKTNCTTTSTSTPVSTPTATPTITAACLNVKAYDTSFNELDATDLTLLKSGDKVRFAVLGTTSGGSIDKARFSINGGSYQETTLKKPGTEEFYYEYTIPAGTVSFSVTAQLHHSIFGWF